MSRPATQPRTTAATVLNHSGLTDHAEIFDQFQPFAEGDFGAAHIFAHQMIDQGRIGVGHQLLGQWLGQRTGSGSQWVHLQWHMALFELAQGEWSRAYQRFQQHILSAAAETEDALTDAPALLWRLQLCATGPVTLPWLVVRRTALRSMQQPCDPLVQLHHLLALAGAGDRESLAWWLRTGRSAPDSFANHLLRRMAEALYAYTVGDPGIAAERLGRVRPHLSRLGGSRAQHALFTDIYHQALRQYTELHPVQAVRRVA